MNEQTASDRQTTRLALEHGCRQWRSVFHAAAPRSLPAHGTPPYAAPRDSTPNDEAGKTKDCGTRHD